MSSVTCQVPHDILRPAAKKKLPNRRDKSNAKTAVNTKPPAAPSANRNQQRERNGAEIDDEEEARHSSRGQKQPGDIRSAQSRPQLSELGNILKIRMRHS